MIIVNVNFYLKDEFISDFINVFNTLSKMVCKEDGCVKYELYPTQEKNTFFLNENWESREALDAHLKMSHMVDFFSSTEKWYINQTEITVYSAEKISL